MSFLLITFDKFGLFKYFKIIFFSLSNFELIKTISHLNWLHSFLLLENKKFETM